MNDALFNTIKELDELKEQNATLLEALWTIANDCVIILDGDDMSGMSDTELFGAMLITATEAIRKAKE